MDVTSTAPPGYRRAPIPRPWLVKNHSESHSSSKEESQADILEKQSWALSWEKLSRCCFPAKEERIKERRHQDIPFPAFPHFRRHSSGSYSSCELDNISGSVSSFTDSDSSSYSSENPANEPSQHTQRCSTPPAAPVAKPPTISTRSRSAGLPPLNPGWVLNTPQASQPVRNRCDTGDFTRTSNTTNTSRHRRLEQFEFSPGSMEQIWMGAKEELPPPSYVLCRDNLQQTSSSSLSHQPHIRRDSGYVSALGMGDESVETWSNFGADIGDYDDDDNEYSVSPFAQLDRKLADTNQSNKHRDWETPPRSKRRRDKIPKQVSPPLDPVYMRKSQEIDMKTDGRLIISGWIAASIGSSDSTAKFISSSKVELKDIFYLRIVETMTGAFLLLNKSNDTVDYSLPLQNDWICESREVSSRIGRCVIVRTISAVVTLLPVSLDDSFFFSTGELVSSKQFRSIRQKLFVTGKGKIYAPDEQHDASMYIMFSLDALIKNCGRY